MQGWNVGHEAQLHIRVLLLESSRCFPPRDCLVQCSTSFSPSHCRCKVGNVHHDNSAKGTFDSGAFLRQQLRYTIVKIDGLTKQCLTTHLNSRQRYHHCNSVCVSYSIYIDSPTYGAAIFSLQTMHFRHYLSKTRLCSCSRGLHGAQNLPQLSQTAFLQDLGEVTV